MSLTSSPRVVAGLSRRALATALGLLGCVGAYAQTGGPTAESIRLPQSSKPVEAAAIEACKDRQEGDRVTFIDAKGKKRKYGCTMVDGVLAARSGVATAARRINR